jgi:hypothetical protein
MQTRKWKAVSFFHWLFQRRSPLLWDRSDVILSPGYAYKGAGPLCNKRRGKNNKNIIIIIIIIISKHKKVFWQVSKILELKHNRYKLLTVRCGNAIGYEIEKEAEKNLSI